MVSPMAIGHQWSMVSQSASFKCTRQETCQRQTMLDYEIWTWAQDDKRGLQLATLSSLSTSALPPLQKPDACMRKKNNIGCSHPQHFYGFTDIWSASKSMDHLVTFLLKSKWFMDGHKWWLTSWVDLSWRQEPRPLDCLRIDWLHLS